ncbi:MAG: hypothetical protein R2941_15405 [Desulfobacterales bacterium]
MFNEISFKQPDLELGQAENNNEAVHPIPIDTEFNIELAEKLAKIESYNKHLYRPTPICTNGGHGAAGQPFAPF